MPSPIHLSLNNRYEVDKVRGLAIVGLEFSVGQERTLI